MNRTILTRASALIAMVALTACSGGGGGQPDVTQPEIKPVSPIPSLTDAHYQTTLGLSADEPMEVSSVATLNAQGAGQRVGTVALLPQGGQSGTGTVELAVAWEGQADTSAGADYISVPVGDDFFESGATQVRETNNHFGSRVLIVENETQGRRLYIPSKDSGTFVGAFSTNFDDADMVAHSVFGRETLSDEIAAQRRSARFDGMAEASVIANSAASGSIDRSGSYVGISGGNVDFDTGNFDLAATMAHEGNGHEIGLSARGVMTADGALISSADFYNLLDNEDQIAGAFEGQVYGPEANNVGATFSAETGDISDATSTAPAVAIAGQMVLAR